MSEEQRIVYAQSQIACAVIKAMGMHAENMQRKHLGQSMAYADEDFFRLIAEHSICAINAICNPNAQFDANIIIAAPDMLAALETVEAAYKTGNSYEDIQRVVKAAIAKAKGKQ